MTIRAALKLCRFLGQVAINVGNYLLTTAFVPTAKKRHARARWLQRACLRHLPLFGCRTQVTGQIPTQGLLVANHLSYLDILVLCAQTPAVFVAKADVRRWPLFGWLSALAGTVFIERERRTHVGAVNRELENALAAGALVVVFPEGTSSNGENVLPFRSPLLEPAVRGGHPITVAWLHYELPGGDARQEVCYWGEHSFFPHLLHLLDKTTVHATLRFAPFSAPSTDRKELANQLRQAVVDLKNQ